MMSTCKFICEDLTQPIKVTLKNSSSTKIIEDICESFELLEDWQVCEILVKSDTKFKILNVLINDKPIDELLYTSWSQDEIGNVFQPFTEFSNFTGKWFLVLHNDFTVLKERCCNSIDSFDYGSNLFKKYRIFVDIGTKLLNNTYPNHLNDFYTRPQGINFYKESNNILNNFDIKIPFLNLSVNFDREKLLAEVKKVDLNLHFNVNLHKKWFEKRLQFNECSEELRSCLSAMGINDFMYLNVFLLEPGGLIDMHKDDKVNLDEKDYYFLHLNLSADHVGSVKISGGGLMPVGLNYLASEYYCHAAVNDSGENRYVISIKCKISQSMTKWILKKSKKRLISNLF